MTFEQWFAKNSAYIPSRGGSTRELKRWFEAAYSAGMVNGKTLHISDEATRKANAELEKELYRVKSELRILKEKSVKNYQQDYYLNKTKPKRQTHRVSRDFDHGIV